MQGVAQNDRHLHRRLAIRGRDGYVVGPAVTAAFRSIAIRLSGLVPVTSSARRAPAGRQKAT